VRVGTNPAVGWGERGNLQDRHAAGGRCCRRATDWCNGIEAGGRACVCVGLWPSLKPAAVMRRCAEEQMQLAGAEGRMRWVGGEEAAGWG
jgi:hypothetical protein